MSDKQNADITADNNGKRRRHRWLRILFRSLASVIIAVILLPFLLYLPPVQTFVKNTACKMVKESSGMDISVDELRLTWPLNLSLRGVRVIEASGDTMASAKELVADVKLLPLFKLDAQINRLELLGGSFRMLSPDSSLLLKIKAGYLKIDGKSHADISQGKIVINEGLIRNGYVDMITDVWKKKAVATDTTASTPFFIQANSLRLENFNFGMSMLPTIDTLNLHASLLTLDKGIIDLGKNQITASALRTDGGSVTYLSPTKEYTETHPAPESEPQDTADPPMAIKADTVALTRFNALYAVKGGAPLPGFDPSYIQASGIGILLAGFYNAASDISLPIVSLEAKERSGLHITEGHGTIGMDKEGLKIDSLQIATPFSGISLTARLPFALMEMKPEAPLNVKADASIGMPDAEAFLPSAREITSRIPGRIPLSVKITASGTLADALLPQFDLELPGILSLNGNGAAKDVADMKLMSGHVDLNGSLSNPKVADNLLGKVGFKLPAFKVKARATAARNTFGLDFKLFSNAGDIAADGKASLGSESYDAEIALKKLNAAYFMPDLGIGRVTASIKAKGTRFNPTQHGAKTDISIDIASIGYRKTVLDNISATASLLDGGFTFNVRSDNNAADFHIGGNGTVAPGKYTFDVEAKIARLDLMAFGLSDKPNGGSADISISGSANPGNCTYDVDMGLSALRWTSGDAFYNIPDKLNARFESDPTRTNASVSGNRALLEFSSPAGLEQLTSAIAVVADSAKSQIDRRVIDVESLTQPIPDFRISLNAAGNGILRKILSPMGLSLDTVYARLGKDSLINGIGAVWNLKTQSMTADTLGFSLSQKGPHIDYIVHLGTRPNNPLAEFANVNIAGFAGADQAKIGIMQKNQKGETGYLLGLTATLADSTVSLKFSPQKALIAYLPWEFNKGNHIDYNIFSHQLKADLQAASKESSIKLITEPNKSGNDELNLDISNVKIQDFLKLSVFAPPITASVNAKLNLGYAKDWLYGKGNLSIGDFTYDKMRVADFDLGFRAARNNDGTTGANLVLKVDGDSTVFFRSHIVPDSTGVLQPDRMGLKLKRFPLYIANPFLGRDVARLSGYLNGDMDMKGSFSDPKLSGHIECDSVGIFIPVMGSQLRLNQDSLNVTDNVVRFNDFDIWGVNKNPIVANGTVDASHLSKIMCNLNMRARNFQLLGNNKRARSDLYGKLFLDLDASAKGTLNLLDVKADLSILSGSDVTYSVPQTTATLTQAKTGDVVTFVNFNDTTSAAKADTVPAGMSMRISAGLTIQPGVSVTVDIPGTATTGNGKVELSPNGTLSYFQNYMGDMKLNGQLNLGNGYARYAIPLVGEKKFTFNPGSYILWRGDIMNPTLSFSASDNIRANLLQNGDSRLVNFIVTLSLANTLSAPKVLFDLSTDDDMSIRNDLMSMSADQRSMAAINLLLTGQYNAQGVKTASSDLVTGSLYGLLTSQLNSFLANNIKGVDISFGVDQYDTTANGESGTAMSYSYQMSKSLFNNKFKISVGGNYTTDASADENFSENLISDISFEYILKQTPTTTMYVRLFRHTGYESILEGEIIETGVGYVLKRRISDFRDFLKWVPRLRKENESDESTHNSGK